MKNTYYCNFDIDLYLLIDFIIFNYIFFEISRTFFIIYQKPFFLHGLNF